MENITSVPKSRVGLVVLGIFAVLVIGWTLFLLFTGNETATIQLGNTHSYQVRVADNSLERMRGLSGVYASDLSPEIGMLFVYDEAKERTFWMKGMTFPLDFVWIKDGKIVKIDKNVQYPPHGTEPEKVSSSPIMVDMVLEVPVGVADELGYLQGQMLTIMIGE